MDAGMEVSDQQLLDGAVLTDGRGQEAAEANQNRSAHATSTMDGIARMRARNGRHRPSISQQHVGIAAYIGAVPCIACASATSQPTVLRSRSGATTLIKVRQACNGFVVLLTWLSSGAAFASRADVWHHQCPRCSSRRRRRRRLRGCVADCLYSLHCKIFENAARSSGHHRPSADTPPPRQA